MKSLIMDQLKGFLIAFFVIILSPIWLIGKKLISFTILEKVDAILWVKLVFTLVILCIFLFLYIIFNRPKFIFDPELGLYKKNKSKLFYCASCYVNGIHSPLKEFSTAWICQNKSCRCPHYKPGCEPLPKKRRVISPGIDL